MRKLQITLFVISMVFSSTQTFRHVYTKWLEPKTSVLDKYDEKIEKDIYESKSINELLALYDTAHKKVEAYEKDETNTEIEEHEKRHNEPYKTKIKIQNSIQKWESYELQISKLRFFWFCGLLSAIVGFIIYNRLNGWVGMVGIITGFSEMIFWTCPTIIGIFGARFEFERLLNNKLFFSIVTWFLLLVAWFLLHKFDEKKI
jgi:hypothetical protein